MNALLDAWNLAGDRAVALAWPLLLQSSVLVVVLLGLERRLGRRLRPAVRHALWLLVPLKLLLGPTLALPTSPVYWLPRGQVSSGAVPIGAPFVDPGLDPGAGEAGAAGVEAPGSGARGTGGTSSVRAASMAVPGGAGLRRNGGVLLVWGLGAVGLLVWLGVRTRQLHRLMAEAEMAPTELLDALERGRTRLGVRRAVGLRLIADGHSPALCGLRRPVVLLPRGLAGRLGPDRLQAVLLHELAHARRADIWVNAFQTLLQVVWWWHPLVWLANARLRLAREESVDDLVAFELGPDDESYPSALLEVAKCVLARPVPSLGLVGILESRSALRGRIERLLEATPVRPPRLGARGLGALSAAALVLLPMARGVSGPAAPAGEGSAPSGVGSLAIGRDRGEIDPIVEADRQLADARIGSGVPGDPGPRTTRRLRMVAQVLAFGPEAVSALGLAESTNPPSAGANYAPPLVPTNDRSPLLAAAEFEAFLAAVARRPDVESVSESWIWVGAGEEIEWPLIESSTNHPAAISLRIRPEWTEGGGRAHLTWVVRTTEIVDLSRAAGAGTLGVDGGGVVGVGGGGSGAATYAVNAIGYINRTLTNAVVLGEGQSCLMAAPPRSEAYRASDKVVVLGDIPWIGRLFRNETTGTRTRHEVVLLTAEWVVGEARSPVPSEPGK